MAKFDANCEYVSMRQSHKMLISIDVIVGTIVDDVNNWTLRGQVHRICNVHRADNAKYQGFESNILNVMYALISLPL